MAPTETIERELKLAAPDGFELPDLGGEPLEPRAFTSTYYDTSDHRLARAGITLRRRVEHGKGLWQLKLPEGTARRELEQAGGPAGPPRDLAHLLVALTHARELSPIAKLRTRRAGYRVADNGNGKADVVLDSVAVMDARRVVGRFTELEVELVEGDEQALEAISGALRKAGAGEDEPRPKVFRILGLPGDDPAAPADDAAALRAMLARQHEQILANDPGVRLGDDPEAVHRLRVATRRLRAVLRAAAPLLEREWSESLREELAWLADALGPVRDLDVFERYLRAEIVRLEPTDEAAAAELVKRLAGERETARTAMLGELESERYFDLLGVLDGAIPPVLATGPSLEAIAGREFAKLRKTILRSGPDPSDEKLHRIRIKGKRARYAAELAEPRVGKRSRRFVQAAKRFQDVVGEHQDAVVAEERIRALAGRRKAGLAFAAGRLVERQAARRAEARAALPQAWARLEKRGRRA
ncbi:MAG: CHAD domain-containing protein [Gaiellaceae bacterium]